MRIFHTTSRAACGRHRYPPVNSHSGWSAILQVARPTAVDPAQVSELVNGDTPRTRPSAPVIAPTQTRRLGSHSGSQRRARARTIDAHDRPDRRLA